MDDPVSGWAADTGGTPRTRDGLKDRARALRKADGDYGGDASYLLDIVAATVLYDHLDQLHDALARMNRGDFAGLDICRVQDRFAHPTPSGYRDIVTNIRFSNGHIGELRLGLKSIWEYSEVGSGRSNHLIVQAIEKAADVEQREMTPEERSLIRRSRIADRDAYDRLWSEAASRQASRVTGPPLESQASSIDPDLPECYVVGLRPVELVETIRGGMEVLAYDWGTGDLVRVYDYLAKICRSTSDNVNRVSDLEFTSTLEQLRKAR